MYVSSEVLTAVYLTGTNVTPRGRASGSGHFDRTCCLHGFKAHQECIVANLSEVWGLFICSFVCFGATAPQWARASSFRRFLDCTQRRITVGRTRPDEWSARRRDVYLITLTTDIHAPGGVRTHNPIRRVAADLRLRPRGHWDRRRVWMDVFK